MKITLTGDALALFEDIIENGRRYPGELANAIAHTHRVFMERFAELDRAYTDAKKEPNAIADQSER
jgi:hypothetical protein